MRREPVNADMLEIISRRFSIAFQARQMQSVRLSVKSIATGTYEYQTVESMATQENASIHGDVAHQRVQRIFVVQTKVGATEEKRRWRRVHSH
jgi:hypothetical protein